MPTMTSPTSSLDESIATFNQMLKNPDLSAEERAKLAASLVQLEAQKENTERSLRAEQRQDTDRARQDAKVEREKEVSARVMGFVDAIKTLNDRDLRFVPDGEKDPDVIRAGKLAHRQLVNLRDTLLKDPNDKHINDHIKMLVESAYDAKEKGFSALDTFQQPGGRIINSHDPECLAVIGQLAASTTREPPPTDTLGSLLNLGNKLAQLHNIQIVKGIIGHYEVLSELAGIAGHNFDTAALNAVQTTMTALRENLGPKLAVVGSTVVSATTKAASAVGMNIERDRLPAPSRTPSQDTRPVFPGAGGGRGAIGS